MRIDTDDLISVTEASQRGVSRLVTDAAEGRSRVVLRNNRPVAMIVGVDDMERLLKLDEAAEDTRLWALAVARSITDSGERFELSDVAAEFGVDLDDPNDFLDECLHDD